jgi:hypothetical protein
MNPQDMVILAQSLMMHGIIGKAKVRKLQRHETNEKTSEFRLPITSSLRNHFGISREEAENLTMTEFSLMLIAKYPDQKGYTREEYDMQLMTTLRTASADRPKPTNKPASV